MKKLTLYKNGSSVGPTEANGATTYGVRLIADEGNVLKNGDKTVYVIDIYDGTEADWTEVTAPITEWTEAELAQAGRILLGGEEADNEED